MKIRERVSDRSGRSLEHYEAMFGTLPVTAGDLLVDVGAGDSPIAHRLPGVRVVSVDPGYRHHPPRIPPPEGSLALARSADHIPEVASGTAACVTVSHLYMHLSRTGVARSIKENIRMARPGGRVLIGPLRARPNLESLPEHVTYREPTYTDGWGRPLGSLAIEIPDDKDTLNPGSLAGQLANERLFGKKSAGDIAMTGLNVILFGDNRVYGIREYDLIPIHTGSET